MIYRALSIATTLIAFFSCSPQQKIFLKEKVIETATEPKSGIHYDAFLFQIPLGPVDVLFVIDNSKSSEAFAEDFQKGYTTFLNLFSKTEAHQLDYRIQVVATPSGLSPDSWFAPEHEAKPQLNELFFGTLKNGRTIPPILRHQEIDYPQPDFSTANAIVHPAFQGRKYIPLYLIYVLGDDSSIESPVGAEGVGRASAISEQALSKARGLYHAHTWVFSRKTDLPTANSYPYCHTFHSAAKFREKHLERRKWASKESIDLCDPSWPKFSENLFKAILIEKSKMILSHPPYLPETMLLRTSNHLFRYGQDYAFDAAANEIRFLQPPNLTPGDLLSLSYYLIPSQETLSGISNPLPAPPLRKRPPPEDESEK